MAIMKNRFLPWDKEIPKGKRKIRNRYLKEKIRIAQEQQTENDRLKKVKRGRRVSVV